MYKWYNILFAAFYRSLGNIDSALRYQYSVWNQLKTSAKYPFFFCASSYQLGELYIETQAYERAITAYDDCGKAAEKINNITFQALALAGKAMAYHYLGQNDAAKDSFLKVLPLLDPVIHINQFTRVMSDLGTFYLDEGQYDEATRHHQRNICRYFKPLSMMKGAII